MATKRDYYDILGVSKTASADEIKSAYRKMALKFHPDRNKEKNAEEKFKEINEAYQVVSDKEKRTAYDQFGHAAFDPNRGGGAGADPFSGGFKSGPFTWSYSSSAGGNPFENSDFGDPFDIFEQFFGAGAAGGRPRKPHYSLRISFMDAVKGAQKEVEVEGKKKNITIPAGVNDGTRMRFDEFDLTFDVAAHPRFQRDGADIFIEEKISITTAALGGTLEVITLDDEKTLKLKVRPGTQSHTLVRLRGEGVPHLRNKGKGDMYVKIVVEVPESLNKEQSKLLKQLAQTGI